MTLAAFAAAVLALLLAPGPTNTLMAVAGAQGGPGRVLRLLPAELAGYLAAILPLAFLGAGVLAQVPQAATALKLAAAVWVMVLAVRLWGRRGDGAAAGTVTPARVALTTLLNPKALIFGLVLLPVPQDPAFVPRLGLFCLMVAAVALAWGAAGALTRGGPQAALRLTRVQRAASLWLAFVSVSLAAGALQG